MKKKYVIGSTWLSVAFDTVYQKVLPNVLEDRVGVTGFALGHKPFGKNAYHEWNYLKLIFNTMPIKTLPCCEISCKISYTKGNQTVYLVQTGRLSQPRGKTPSPWGPFLWIDFIYNMDGVFAG